MTLFQPALQGVLRVRISIALRALPYLIEGISPVRDTFNIQTAATVEH